MHDHALYLHVLSSSLRRQIVERPSTFAEKVTFELRFLLTSADIYHCLFGGPLALCLLISFHINSCFFDKITGFVSFFGLKKVKHDVAHGNSNADILPLVKRLEAHLLFPFLSAFMSQINICPYFPREDVFPVSYYLNYLLPPWFYGEADLGKGRLVCTKHKSQRALLKKALYLSINGQFSTKVLIRDTIFTSPNGDRTAILRGHPSRTKAKPLAVQREYLHFSVILRPWVIVRARETNCPQVLNWLQSISALLYCAYYTKAEEGLPTSDFRPPTSDFRLPTYLYFDFIILQTSDLTKCELRISDFWPFRLKAEWLDLQTSHFPHPTFHFQIPISDFWFPTSHFPLPTSHFLLLTSDFRFPTSDFQLPTSDF